MPMDQAELPVRKAMEILVKDNKLRSALNDAGLCKRRYGVEMAKIIMIRLAALRAANSLADFWPPKSGPERCHELKGDGAGTFTVDLKQPYRLIFESAAPPDSPDRSDEQKRWSAITAINVLTIEDTHG
jgi:plasmid maintenance system killer protein